MKKRRAAEAARTNPGGLEELGKVEGGETDRCVIGTLNASAMNSERLATYLGLAEDTGVDVLCGQET